MSFSKTETQVAKGVAVILMVYHHLFFDMNLSAPYGVVFPLIGAERGYDWAQYAKVCVFVFVFLSAYGVARATAAVRGDAALTRQQKNAVLGRYTGRRYLAVMAGFLFIFVIVLGVAYGYRGAPRSLPDPNAVYGTGFYGACYLLIDALGLAFISGNPTLNPEWWYMSVAILIVFLMPVFLRWYENSGITSWLACLVLSFWFYQISAEGVGHLMLLPLGIAFAENNWFERFKAWQPLRGAGTGARIGNKCIRIGICLVCFLLFLKASRINNGFYFCQQLATPALIMLSWEALAVVPFVGRGVAFVGKHSMNIYFTHTLLMRSFADLLFGLQNALLITLVLLGTSLALSVVLEMLKKLLRYDRLVTLVTGRLMPTAPM